MKHGGGIDKSSAGEIVGGGAKEVQDPSSPILSTRIILLDPEDPFARVHQLRALIYNHGKRKVGPILAIHAGHTTDAAIGKPAS